MFTGLTNIYSPFCTKKGSTKYLEPRQNFIFSKNNFKKKSTLTRFNK